MNTNNKTSQSSFGYSPNFYPELARLEAGHFWFRSRNRLILTMLEKYRPHFASFLEIGCGTGFVLSAVAEKWSGRTIAGSDFLPEGLSFAASRVPDARLLLLDGRALPFVSTFEAIGAFDVLEHIQEDESVLTQIHNALLPGGLLLLTVPQHPWLWSWFDAASGHKRRYTAKELHRKLSRAGFEIVRSTSFVSLLLPLLLVSRFRQRPAQEADPLQALAISRVLNAVLQLLMDAEVLGIQTGLNLPLGGSRLVVGKK
jgi:SAM-dependent methyltransferase